MQESGDTPPPLPPPALPINYPNPAKRPSRFGLIVFCLSILSLAFMATSYSMYRHLLGFNQRTIQLGIAWASIALGGISALLSPIALLFRRGPFEIAAIIIAILYWLVFI